jgi:hypothetical protein
MKLKTELYTVSIASIITIALLTVSGSKLVRAKEPPAPPRACVILQGTQRFYNGGPTGYSYPGIAVYCSSASPGAPQFPNPMLGGTNQVEAAEMAAAIAQCLESGLHLQSFDPQTLTAVMVR